MKDVIALRKSFCLNVFVCILNKHITYIKNDCLWNMNDLKGTTIIKKTIAKK